MNVFRRSSRTILAFVATSFYWMEKRERERKLDERLKRLEEKQNWQKQKTNPDPLF